MRLALFIIILLVSTTICAQHIVINEIMYAPLKPEPEWIELFNSGDSSIHIKNWKIADHLHSYTITSDPVLAANGYLILTKDTSNYLENHYAISNPLIVRTQLPSFTNTGDDITIKDSLGNIIDSIRYQPSWGGVGGTHSISLERIDYLGTSDSSNFGSSIDPLGATPGKINSIHRKNYDLALLSIEDSITNNSDLSFTITLQNKGRKEISSGTVSLLSEQVGLPIAAYQISVPIEPNATEHISLTWQNADYGKSTITAVANIATDEDASNDTIKKTSYFPIPRNAIVINEIMAAPATGASQWIELYNNSANAANMDSTALRVELNGKFYTFLIDNFRVQPKQYSVICADSNFYYTYPLLRSQSLVRNLNKIDFHLKDTGNVLMLVNADTSLIDSLHFYLYWYLPVTKPTGISLERRQFSAPSTDPGNWGASIDTRGSTPLAKNSNAFDSVAIPKTADVQISPNPFSPDADGFEDVTNITIYVPSEHEEQISAKLYDLRGRLHKTFLNNQSVDRAKQILFDGKDDNGQTLPIGLYTLVVESSSGIFNPERKGIVIVKKPK